MAVSKGFRPGWAFTLLAAAGLTTLLFLGIWQLQRLAWKEDLIATIEAGLAAPATRVDELDDIEAFTRVAIEGELATDRLTLFGTTTLDRELAMNVLATVRGPSSRNWLADLGPLPERLSEQALAGELSIERPASVEGILVEPQGRGPFTPANDPADGQFYAHDLGELETYFGLPLEPWIFVSETPLRVELLNADPVVLVNRVSADLPNNHLGYAITWFGLAGGLLAIYVAFGRHRARNER